MQWIYEVHTEFRGTAGNLVGPTEMRHFDTIEDAWACLGAVAVIPVFVKTHDVVNIPTSHDYQMQYAIIEAVKYKLDHTVSSFPDDETLRQADEILRQVFDSIMISVVHNRSVATSRQDVKMLHELDAITAACAKGTNALRCNRVIRPGQPWRCSSLWRGHKGICCSEGGYCG